MKTHLKIAKIIRVRRAAAGLTRQELSDASGLSLTCIAELERGTQARLALRSVMLIAQALGVKLRVLTGDRWV